MGFFDTLGNAASKGYSKLVDTAEKMEEAKERAANLSDSQLKKEASSSNIVRSAAARYELKNRGLL